MTKLLENKVCIITGAAGINGIGLRTAKLFYEHGASIVITDLNEEACTKVRSMFDEERSLVLVANVTSKDDSGRVAREVVEKFGRIDVLVNNAGITQPVKFEEIQPEDYDRILDVNLRGMLYMSQAVTPQMKQQSSGSIINTSSVSAQRGGVSLVAPITVPPRQACWGSARLWHASLGRTAFGLTPSPQA